MSGVPGVCTCRCAPIPMQGDLIDITARAHPLPVQHYITAASLVDDLKKKILKSNQESDMSTTQMKRRRVPGWAAHQFRLWV